MRIPILFACVVTGSWMPQEPESFPASWTGRWKGELRTVSAAGKESKHTMELEIGAMKNGRAAWTIVYDGKEVRRYELVERGTPGRYGIDEQQGIELEMTLLDGALYGLFIVQGQQIWAAYRRVDDRLEVELVISKVADGKTTGGGVETFAPSSVQKAVLRRAK
jgi:hypothetical protein